MFSHPLPPDAELRLLELRHAQALFDLTEANREHLDPWFGWIRSSTSVADVQAHLATRLGDFAAGKGFSAGVWLQDAAAGTADQFRLVGSVGFHNHDPISRGIELGYWLAADVQGRGLMTRAVRAMITHAFTSMNIHRVKIMAAPENVRSAGVCRRLGLREEGVHKEASWTGAGWRDLVSFAILKHEWEQPA